MKLTLKETSTTHRVLLYGGPKVGKTELAAKLSEHYKLLWFDLENGYATMLKLPDAWKERIDIISLPDSRVYPIAIETMMKVVKGTECIICDAHGKVSCALCKKDSLPVTRVCLNETQSDTIVVIDSLTQFTNSGIAHITKTQPDDYKLQQDDWGALRVLMDKFLSQIQVARYNVVCITHEEEVLMEDGKKKLVPVCGSSNSSRNTAKYFDHVVYCEVKNKKHAFGSGTGYGMNMVTGSRTDVLLEKADEKNPASLLSIFTSWKDEGFEEKLEAKIIPIAIPIESTERELAKALIVSNKLEAKLIENIALTPGQIALANLKKRQEAEKERNKIL